MTPEQYGQEFRRYRTFCRNYGDNRLYCIAGGADVADYQWTEGVMKTAAYTGNRRLMDGISLHYYTQPNTWEHKKEQRSLNCRIITGVCTCPAYE